MMACGRIGVFGPLSIPWCSWMAEVTAELSCSTPFLLPARQKRAIFWRTTFFIVTKLIASRSTRWRWQAGCWSGGNSYFLLCRNFTASVSLQHNMHVNMNYYMWYRQANIMWLILLKAKHNSNINRIIHINWVITYFVQSCVFTVNFSKCLNVACEIFNYGCYCHNFLKITSSIIVCNYACQETDSLHCSFTSRFEILLFLLLI